MQRKSDYQPLNDGLLEYGDIVTQRDEKTAKKMGETFEKKGSLFFGYKSIVAKYDSYQVSNLSVVDIKVQCYHVPGFKKSEKIKINSELFEIESIDIDSKQEYMYLFLRKVGYWNGGNYIKAS
ncbi:TPA: phage head-tail adapter protein [Streptococcus suis]|nr:phage head-tail adapter protein [Streptococcus suis]